MARFGHSMGRRLLENGSYASTAEGDWTPRAEAIRPFSGGWNGRRRRKAGSTGNRRRGMICPRTREESEASRSLGPEEHALLFRSGGPTRLGFAVPVRFFAREGRLRLPQHRAYETGQRPGRDPRLPCPSDEQLRHVMLVRVRAVHEQGLSPRPFDAEAGLLVERQG